MVIVGAGPAGAHAAACMARGGVRVLLVDRRPEGLAGAQWVNGVAEWMFDEAGVEQPVPPENLGGHHRFTLLTPSGQHRVDVDDNPILEVDMRLLGQRLASEVERAGGEVRWELSVQDVELNAAGRPIALMARRADNGRGAHTRLMARLFVDASGLSAVLRRQMPSLDAACPDPEPEDLCVAAQEVRRISDPKAARAWLEANGGKAGQTLAWTGQHGGFSVLNVRMDEAFETFSILTGAIAVPQYPSGRKILDTFVAEHAWAGERIFGGARALPLRRPYSRLIAPGMALLGDAACQVYSAHGSGIGIGMIAGRMLADAVIEAVAAGQDPGSLSGLWRYPTRFHRRWGGLLAGIDLFRRFSQSLSQDDMEKMMACGLLTSKMAAGGLAQKPPEVPAGELPKLLLGALKAPGLMARMLPVLLRAPLVQAVARTYPRLDRSHADVALFRYERWMRWLVESVDFGGSRPLER